MRKMKILGGYNEGNDKIKNCGILLLVISETDLR